MRGAVIVAVAGVVALGAGGGLFHRDLEERFKTIQINRGEDVQRGAFDYVVGLTYGTERTPRCGGVLIAPRMVLTAAHCVCAHRPSNVFVGVNPNDTNPATRGLYYEVIDSREALVCGQEKIDTGVDVAVLELRNAPQGVRWVGLAADSVVDRARRYRIVGYGALDPNGQTFEYEKQQAEVASFTNTCRGDGDTDRYRCQPGEVVAGRADGADSCMADSGGPLLVSPAGDAGPKSGEGVQVAGVTSRGVKPAPTVCGRGGVYERMQPRLRAWIADAMQSMQRS